MPEAGKLRSTVAPSSPGPTTPLGVLSGPIIPTLLRLALPSAAMLGGAWGRK
jgi:hypothetical protein